MSSARQALTIVGQVAGFALGGPVGAFIGGAIGGEVGGAIDGPPEGPRLDDTSAPALEFGSKVARLHGTVWCTLSPRWWSGLRESSQVVGGKGADSGVDQAVYHADLFGVLGEIDLVRYPNATWTRIRIDGELVASRLATATPATLLAATSTDRWSDAEFLNGDAAQAPWSVMEAAEGVGSTNAYRGQAGMGFTNLLMVNGRRPSLIEVEVCTNPSVGALAAMTRLRVNIDGDMSDTSNYAASPTTIGSPGDMVVGNTIVIGPVNADTGFSWSGAQLVADVLANGWTFEASATWHSGVTDGKYVGVWNNGGTTLVSVDIATPFPSTQWRFRAVLGGTPTQIGPLFDPFEFAHIAIVRPPGASVTARVYVNGILVHSYTEALAGSGASGTVTVYKGAAGAISTHEVAFVGLSWGELYTATFTPPADLPAADAPAVTVTPQTVDLQDVLESEMLRCKPLTAARIDMSAAAGKQVHGFKAANSAATDLARLLDWFYLELFCLDKIICVERGGAVEQTIAYGYSGAGVEGASEPFAGLVRDNDNEVPVRAAVQYVNLLADGEGDTRTGQRIAAGSKVMQFPFSIYALPSEAQGRADTIAHDARNATHRASVRLGATQAGKVQPASVLRFTDNKGNTYRTRVLRLVWNRGVYETDVVLDDPDILAAVGIANDVDNQVIDIAASPEAEFLALDLPKLRTADNDPAYLALVKTTAHAAGARWFDSPDDVTFAAKADFANDAIFGSVTAVEGAFGLGVRFDEGSTITASLGADAAPASVTRAALLANRQLNAFAVGVNGRMVLGQFRSATALGGGVWKFSGLVNMGARGTEQYCGSIAVADHFALLGTAGTALVPRAAAQLGVPLYVKAVAIGRSLDSAASVAFTCHGVNVTPLSPIALRAERDHSSGDIALTWTARTRDDTRFGGDLGDAWALGEAIELWRVRLYTDLTGATLVRDLGSVSTRAATYTAAQRATDGHTLTSPLYVQVTLVSAVAGEGYPRLEAA